MKVLKPLLILFLFGRSFGQPLPYLENFENSFQNLMEDGWYFQGWSECDDITWFNNVGNCDQWISGEITRWEVSSSYNSINTSSPALIYNWSPAQSSGNVEFEHEIISKPINVENNTEVLVRMNLALDFFSVSI